MSEKRVSIHGHWSSRWAFILYRDQPDVAIGGIFTGCFCAWVLRDQNTAQELDMPESSIAYKSWYWSMRFLTPAYQ